MDFARSIDLKNVKLSVHHKMDFRLYRFSKFLHNCLALVDKDLYKKAFFVRNQSITFKSS